MNDASPVLLYSVVDSDGNQYATATLTPTDDTREKIVLSKPYIIPVLFLPGIMGTNLRKKDGKQAVWQPPNADARGAVDMIAQLFSYAFKNTQERVGDLATSDAEVDPSGPIDAGESGLPKNVLVARGWGALMRASYHPFMAQLQHQLNALAQFDFKRCEADLKGWAEKHGHEAPRNGAPPAASRLRGRKSFMLPIINSMSGQGDTTGCRATAILGRRSAT